MYFQRLSPVIHVYQVCTDMYSNTSKYLVLIVVLYDIATDRQRRKHPSSHTANNSTTLPNLCTPEALPTRIPLPPLLAAGGEVPHLIAFDSKCRFLPLPVSAPSWPLRPWSREVLQPCNSSSQVIAPILLPSRPAT